MLLRTNKTTKLFIWTLIAVALTALFINTAGAARAKKDVYPLIKAKAPTFASYASISTRFQVRWSPKMVLANQQVSKFYVLYRRQFDRKWEVLPSLGTEVTTARRASFVGKPGETYVFRIAGIDTKGHVGAPAIVKTVVPLDDNADNYKRYRGTWVTSRKRNYFQRTEHQSKTSGDVFTYKFDGRRVYLIGSKGPKRGQAKIFVDGVSYGTVDFKARSYRTRKLLWRSPPLKPVSSIKRHKLKVVVVGTRGRPRIGIDAVARTR